MATRSRIGIENEDGRITSIYCHFDGYPSNNGQILVEHYRTTEKVLELMGLGDLSSLAGEIGEQQDFDNPNEKQCLAYGRDRGEVNTEAVIHQDEIAFLDYRQEFNYLYRDEEWWVQGGHDYYQDQWHTVASVLHAAEFEKLRNQE